jgi:hypothetical protein
VSNKVSGCDIISLFTPLFSPPGFRGTSIWAAPPQKKWYKCIEIMNYREKIFHKISLEK